MPNIPYHSEPLPDISGHWVCINRIAELLLERMCSGPDVICELEEALCQGLLRSRIQMGCERKHVTPPEWTAVFQLVWLDAPEGWLVEIAMRDTSALLVATCYIWRPDCDRLWATKLGGATDPRPKQPKTTPKQVRLPEWLEAVVPTFGGKAPYPSLGSLRDAIKSELDLQHRTYPEDRTIERILSKHCPSWFVIAKK